MDVSKIKRMIGHCKNPEELNAVITAAKLKRECLRISKKEKIMEEAWQKVKTFKKNSFVVVNGLSCSTEYWVVPHGKSKTKAAYGTFKRGVYYRVHQVQPRAKRLWVVNYNGDYICFRHHQFDYLNLKNYPDVLTAQVAVENLK